MALNVKVQTMKLSEEQAEEYLQNHTLEEAGKDFFERTQKATLIGKDPELDIIKIEIYRSSNVTRK